MVLDGTEYQILLDTGASKSFMPKSHCLRGKSSHITESCIQNKEFKQEMDNTLVCCLLYQ